MNEQFLPQDLKDTLPYFLGAVDESHFLLIGELDELQRRLKTLEATEAKQLQAVEVSRSRVTRVLNEGKKVGLIGQDYQAVDDTVFAYLATVAEYPMDEAELIPDFGETIERLRGEQVTLQNRLGDMNQDIRAARSYLSDQSDFSREATEQRARLKSIELFKTEVASPHQCHFATLNSQPQSQPLAK